MLKLYGILDGIKTLKDGGIKLAFDTNEITPEQGAEAMRLRNQAGWLVFDSEPLPESVELPERTPREVSSKSKSQRLRSIIHLRWKKDTTREKTTLSEDDYYDRRMEVIIQNEKNLLND